MSVFQKANELGQEILASPQYQAYQKAEQALADDDDAQALADRYSAIKEELTQRLSQPGADKDELAALNAQLEEAKRALAENHAFSVANEAAGDFSKLMAQVNQVLRFIVTGEMDDDSACGGDCSGCGGGCGHSH